MGAAEPVGQYALGETRIKKQIKRNTYISWFNNNAYPRGHIVRVANVLPAEQKYPENEEI